jgi:hypothetical protein
MIRGRTYTCAAGAFVDVPDFDAGELEVNGWTIATLGGFGPTSGRPRPDATKRGLTFVDTSLSKMIICNGAAWLDPVTGAEV